MCTWNVHYLATFAYFRYLILQLEVARQRWRALAGCLCEPAPPWILCSHRAGMILHGQPGARLYPHAPVRAVRKRVRTCVVQLR